MLGAMFWRNSDKSVPTSEVKARRKWDSAHLRTVSCRVDIGTYERFRKLCMAKGETVYSMMKRIVVEMVKRASVENFVEK